MTTRPKLAWTILMAASMTMGCAGQSPTSNSDDPGLGPKQPSAERDKISAEECEAKGGSLVGDIGNGAIHREDYRCENGQAPIGTIVQDPEGPIAIEGSVCCPGGDPSTDG